MKFPVRILFLLLVVSVASFAAPLRSQEAGAPKNTKSAPSALRKAEALEDLEALGQRLREEVAYLGLHQARPFEAIAALKQRLPESIGWPDFARELPKSLSPIGDCHSGDCHSGVTCEAEENEAGLWLPFRLASAQGGIIAVTRENTAFVESGHPYLVAIREQRALEEMSGKSK